ncbi:MAG: phosphoribosylglycinamide formyltransferase [Candidatus Endonucleobacter sp. (ex Gigantidas childressi)]|nr:phosphoribosylglycinamide formyltransferase [Candidatus Endonucleobacter sp. (ex Gigantidas childressi)]
MTTNNRIVVLFSGSGSNLQALLDQQEGYSYDVVGAISNRPDASGLKRLKHTGIPALVLDHREFDSRESYDLELIRQIDHFNPGLVVLAGYMRILTAKPVRHFQYRLINIHPSRLPDYKGLNTHQRVLADRQKTHGATVHFVTEALDSGAIILQASLAVKLEDDEHSLRKRVQAMEHQIYPMAVDMLTSNRLQVSNQQLFLDAIPLGDKGYQMQEQYLIDKL